MLQMGLPMTSEAVKIKPTKLDMSQFLDCFEQLMFDRGHIELCGVDEAGRGPLAGPVVAAAVILPAGIVIEGLDDSKKLSPGQRDEVFAQIIERNLPCAVGIIDSETIDKINIHKASLRAMRKAVMDLKKRPEIILVDGNHPIPNIAQLQYAIIGGDRRCKSIAAASIVAKVTRDRIMERYQALHPNFTFSVHKGYPTPTHLKELQDYGPCDIHRLTYKPVTRLLKENALV